MAAMQLTGKQLPVDYPSYSDDEKHELLRESFAGRNVLLCLGEKTTHETLGILFRILSDPVRFCSCR